MYGICGTPQDSTTASLSPNLTFDLVQEGNVGVWKADERGRLVSVSKIRKGHAAITHIVFRTHDTRSPAG